MELVSVDAAFKYSCDVGGEFPSARYENRQPVQPEPTIWPRSPVKMN